MVKSKKAQTIDDVLSLLFSFEIAETAFENYAPLLFCKEKKAKDMLSKKRRFADAAF